jgi:hypothetical protein
MKKAEKAGPAKPRMDVFAGAAGPLPSQMFKRVFVQFALMATEAL